MELGLVDWVLCATLLFLVLYKLGTWNHDYFTSSGIKTIKIVPFFGSMSTIIFRTKSSSDFIVDNYKEFKNERLVGGMQFFIPIIIIHDPELVKSITVKYFDHFTDHIQTVSSEGDMFGKNLFNLKGQRWRDMRAVLSPAFTSSKMKNMFRFMDHCGQQIEDYLQNEIDNLGSGKPFILNAKDMFSRYANDVIATSAFGVQIDSLKERDNEFYQTGKQIMDFRGIKFIKIIGFMLCPKLMEIFGITFHSKKEIDFFYNLIHDTITTREKEGIVRPDMVHLLMQARKGELKTEKGEEDEVDGNLKSKKIDLTETDIVAQGLVFFAAGYETTSTTLSFVALLLAIHQDEQRKLQQEIDELLGDDKEVTYEKVQKMKYMDMVISESLRLYPPVMAMNRTCTKTFTIPATDTQPEFTFKKGDTLWVAVNGIHRDPDYFPDPEKFYPERFGDENKHNIKPFTFLPFGGGPRVCIGQRFALLEIKVAIIHILSRFNLIVVDKTPVPIKIDARRLNVEVEGGFWVGVTPRKQAAR